MWLKATLFGVFLGKQRLSVCYLWFQHAAFLQEVTITFMHLHLIQVWPGNSSCETERGWARRALRAEQELPASVLGSWLSQGGLRIAGLTSKLHWQLLGLVQQAGVAGSVCLLQPRAHLLQGAVAELRAEDGLDPLQQPVAQQQRVQHGPGATCTESKRPASARPLCQQGRQLSCLPAPRLWAVFSVMLPRGVWQPVLQTGTQHRGQEHGERMGAASYGCSQGPPALPWALQLEAQ